MHTYVCMCTYVCCVCTTTTIVDTGGIKIFVSNSGNNILLVSAFNEFYLSKIGMLYCRALLLVKFL